MGCSFGRLECSGELLSVEMIEQRWRGELETAGGEGLRRWLEALSPPGEDRPFGLSGVIVLA